jgi:ketosteroid isomerase-like protein
MGHEGPVGVMHAWADAYETRDLDTMMALFETDSVWVSPEGKIVAGPDSIRSVFADFMALDAEFRPGEPQVIETGDIALLHADWSLDGTDAEGQAVSFFGRTADVLRRGSNGRWHYLIDDPFGGSGQRGA